MDSHLREWEINTLFVEFVVNVFVHFEIYIPIVTVCLPILLSLH